MEWNFWAPTLFLSLIIIHRLFNGLTILALGRVRRRHIGPFFLCRQPWRSSVGFYL